MFVILGSKPGQYRTEPGPGDGLEPVEAWHYLFAGRLRARFVVARLLNETRITITEDTPPYPVNRVPTKFLPRFATLQAARDELAQLVRHGGADSTLQQAPL